MAPARETSELNTQDWAALVVVALGVALAPLFLVARHQSLRDDFSRSEEPLTPAELSVIKKWDRVLVWSFPIVIAGWLTWTLFLALRFGGAGWVGWLWLSSSVLVVTAAMSLKFAPRCPRCRYRLGLGSGLSVPRRCERCGAILKR
jgi:hypothetical protein